MSSRSFPAGATPSVSPRCTTLPEIRLTATYPDIYSGDVVITSTDPDVNPFEFTAGTIYRPRGCPGPGVRGLYAHAIYSGHGAGPRQSARR